MTNVVHHVPVTLEDLQGIIYLLLIVIFLILLELTRRKICTLYQITFILSFAWLFLSVGGLIDNHLSDDLLSRIVYGIYMQQNYSYIYNFFPLFSILLITIILIIYFWYCNCTCCCDVKLINPKIIISHSNCRLNRLRLNLSLYFPMFLVLYFFIGIRLNIRLRGSAIKPIGGTLHWQLFKSQFLIAMIHLYTGILLILYDTISHIDTPFQKLSLTHQENKLRYCNELPPSNVTTDRHIDNVRKESSYYKDDDREAFLNHKKKEDNSSIEASRPPISIRQRAPSAMSSNLNRQSYYEKSLIDSTQIEQNYNIHVENKNRERNMREDKENIGNDENKDNDGKTWDYEYSPVKTNLSKRGFKGKDNETFSLNLDPSINNDIWTQHVDTDSKQIYYYNQLTGECTWHNPKSLVDIDETENRYKID